MTWALAYLTCGMAMGEAGARGGVTGFRRYAVAVAAWPIVLVIGLARLRTRGVRRG